MLKLDHLMIVVIPYNDKLKELGWKQSVSFDKGLENVINHYNNTCIIMVRNVKNNSENVI